MALKGYQASNQEVAQYSGFANSNAIFLSHAQQQRTRLI
jgi:hypothetical protein